VGVTQLAIDPAGVLAPLGSLPDEELGDAFAAIAGDAILPLGTAVVTRGGRSGSVVMRVRIRRAGWGEERIDVRAGGVAVVPLPRGAQAELEIDLAAGASLGTARRSDRVVARASGGSVGIILDGRGAPLALPRRTDDRRAVLAGWREALIGEPAPRGGGPS
jgi:hypothetical protein